MQKKKDTTYTLEKKKRKKTKERYKKKWKKKEVRGKKLTWSWVGSWRRICRKIFHIGTKKKWGGEWGISI
jgi:hypothetical protein